MQTEIELQQIIHRFLATQIEFGVCRFGMALPTMEEASHWFSVSLDTVRAAYLRLRQEGYITLSKCVGAAVAVQFSEPEIERHIQVFFSLRRDAAIDLCRAMGPLFRRAQFFALKYATPEQLDQLEQYCSEQDILPPYKMVRCLRLIYATLHNTLLMRLVWQAFMFCQAPFLSLEENRTAFESGDGSLPHMIQLSRRQDWDGLMRAIDLFQSQLFSAISRFYEDRITMAPPGEPVAFQWSVYQKSSQRCYSLAIDFLIDMNQGVYKEGDFLPAPAKLAKAKQVSISTVRRTLTLLNQLGATHSINGVGTQVQYTESNVGNGDLLNPVIQKRLRDFVESLQILTLTCAASIQATFSVMDPAAIEQRQERLLQLKRIKRHETVVFACFEAITQYAPIQALRDIYTQLQQILMWGFPLRCANNSREEINAFYQPHIDFLAACLERRDADALAAGLENILRYEFKFALERLHEQKIYTDSSPVLPE